MGTGARPVCASAAQTSGPSTAGARPCPRPWVGCPRASRTSSWQPEASARDSASPLPPGMPLQTGVAEGRWYPRRQPPGAGSLWRLGVDPVLPATCGPAAPRARPADSDAWVRGPSRPGARPRARRGTRASSTLAACASPRGLRAKAKRGGRLGAGQGPGRCRGAAHRASPADPRGPALTWCLLAMSGQPSGRPWPHPTGTEHLG